MSINLNELKASIKEVHAEIQSQEIGAPSPDIERKIKGIVEKWKSVSTDERRVHSDYYIPIGDYKELTKDLYLCILDENEKINFKPSRSWFSFKTDWDETTTPIRQACRRRLKDRGVIDDEDRFNHLPLLDQKLLLSFQDYLSWDDDSTWKLLNRVTLADKQLMLSNKENLLALFAIPSNHYNFKSFLGTPQEKERFVTVANHIQTFIQEEANRYQLSQVLDSFSSIFHDLLNMTSEQRRAVWKGRASRENDPFKRPSASTGQRTQSKPKAKSSGSTSRPQGSNPPPGTTQNPQTPPPQPVPAQPAPPSNAELKAAARAFLIRDLSTSAHYTTVVGQYNQTVDFNRSKFRTAYLKLAFALHPDKIAADDPQKTIKEEAWKIVNEMNDDITRNVLKEK